ncbi:MAG: adenylate/guanylate cyclase domain-containing protein, partial [Candidatus Promineifilaceae bacterium]|nr:adenylate/guanylate cyclase domain-containing protein [Candidatus Promineifilaceae bacterium]
MDERQQLEDAVAALNAQRAVLGDAAVDAALAGLRQKLAQLESGALEKNVSAAKLPSERRFVTILFGDIMGSTALAEKLDPEEWTEIMDHVFDYLIEPVERYEGTVARLMGDGILAFFGAPQAHEDDPQRAVLAGLAIIENIQTVREKLGRERGLALAVRVGINSGLAVVGDVGSETAGEYTAMGSAVNLAARMEQTAEPGTVQVSRETYKHAAPLFEWQALGPVQVKGKADPVHTYRPLSLKKRPGPLRGLASHGINSLMVGREQELDQLLDAMRRLESGQGAVVSVIGEAGLGKSRLVAEFRDLAAADREQSPRWLEARALSYGSSIVYYAWRQIIRQSIAADESDSAPIVQGRLQTACLRLDYPAEKIPFLAAMLGIERQDDPASAAVKNGENLARHIRDACGEYLRRLAAESTTVLVFEDLHWGDSASLELLADLCDLVIDRPLLILTVYRPDQAAEIQHFRQVAGQKLGRSHIELKLQALPEHVAQALLQNLLVDQDLPRPFVDAIFRKSEGNPLFIEEVVRMLLDSGDLQPVGAERQNAWALASKVSESEIPGSLQGLLVARIDQLDEEARHTLQKASVIGRSFYFRVLQRIAAAVSSLEQSVSTLERADLIRLEAKTPELEYAFRHALIQEATYSTILLKERRALHRRAAEAIELLFPEEQDSLAPVLAAHYDRAGMNARALQFYITAGDAAFKLYANADATVHYGQAIAVLNREPGGSAALTEQTTRRLYLN